jgi:hypothetical protein
MGLRKFKAAWFLLYRVYKRVTTSTELKLQQDAVERRVTSTGRDTVQYAHKLEPAAKKANKYKWNSAFPKAVYPSSRNRI